MSRVRFHGMKAVGELCDLTWSGPNWESWDNEKTATENVAQLYEGHGPDLVVAYKPLEIKGYAELDALKCIRYNEMYDVQWTIKEIMESRSNIVVCHHKNDMEQYEKLLQNFKLLNYYIGAIFVRTNEFKRTRCKNRQDANRGRMETAWLVKR